LALSAVGVPGPARPAAVRRLATGLIAYGVIGLALAVVGLIALVWVGGRVTAITDRVSTQVESSIATLDRAARALGDAGSTAGSFAVTLERTPPVVRQAAATVGNLQTELRSVEQQLDSVAILGSRPLAGAARPFGQMAADIEGLDTRLGLIATDLEDNKAALLDNADSLRASATQVEQLADDLRAGVVESSLADVGLILTVMFLLLVAWAALPAAGALGVGLWLRREYGPR
jgi:hypothetical protein